MRRSCVGTKMVPPPNDGNFVLLVAPGVPPPPRRGAVGIIKKIWFWFLSFLFFYFCIFYFCFIVFSACLISRVISFSASWCPVAVLGCAAMISWTWAARLVPIHPRHSGSSGISWRIYFRSWVHFFIQRFPSAATASSNPLGLSSSVAGGRNPLNATIAIIPKIPQ